MEINLVEALEATQEIIQKAQTVPFGKYSSVYVSPTGNVKSVLQEYHQNEKVLTIGAMGAYAYEAMLHGAKEIDLFDINILQYLYYELINLGIRTFSFEQFIHNFTSYFSNSEFEKKAFHENQRKRQEQIKKIREDLLREEQDLFDNRRDYPEIKEKQVLINWHTFLRDSMKKDLDWSYQNATIENGVITPQPHEISYPEAEILLDTSGSIQESQLRRFLMECRNLTTLATLKIGCFDRKFYGFHEIRSIKDLEEMPIHGGGGTDFDIALSAFDRRVENKILFTDGKAPMPKIRMNVLWIVMGEKIYPKGGKVFYIPKEDIEKRKIKEKAR